jgi:hypothetical protein
MLDLEQTPSNEIFHKPQCYKIIPPWTVESSLGVHTPLPRQKTTFGHYHSYRLIMPIKKREGEIV